MTEHEKYQEHIRHTHDAFCKTVIRHAAIDAARSIRSRRKREISLDYLMDEKHYPFSTTDEYFAEVPTSMEYPFTACGQTVLLKSPHLAAALSSLSEMEQEIIYLYYFERMTHKEIGKRYGRTRSTTGRRIQIILQRLQAELEGFTMSQLLPYETIVKASEGDPEAVAAVLSHYAGYIRACSKMDGHINVEMQEHIIQKLIESLFKFRFDRDN